MTWLDGPHIDPADLSRGFHSHIPEPDPDDDFCSACDGTGRDDNCGCGNYHDGRCEAGPCRVCNGSGREG